MGNWEPGHHPGGRPPTWTDPKVLQDQIDDYFETVRIEEKVPAIGMLAVHLGVDRETILNYQDKPKYFGTIKKAKIKIQSMQEELALRGKTNPAFTIFSFKNNYGWSDKTQHEHTGEVKIDITGLIEQAYTDDEDEDESA